MKPRIRPLGLGKETLCSLTDASLRAIQGGMQPIPTGTGDCEDPTATNTNTAACPTFATCNSDCTCRETTGTTAHRLTAASC